MIGQAAIITARNAVRMAAVNRWIESPCAYIAMMSGSNAASVKPMNARLTGVSTTSALATMPAITNDDQELVVPIGGGQQQRAQHAPQAAHRDGPEHEAGRPRARIARGLGRSILTVKHEAGGGGGGHQRKPAPEYGRRHFTPQPGNDDERDSESAAVSGTRQPVQQANLLGKYRGGRLVGRGRNCRHYFKRLRQARHASFPPGSS